MELVLHHGDYVFNGINGLRRAAGKDALLQRVLFRLTARRGSLAFWENMGSRLWQLGRLPQEARAAAAKQYVVEALAEETDVSVKQVSLLPIGDRASLTAELEYEGLPLSVTMDIRM